MADNSHDLTESDWVLGDDFAAPTPLSMGGAGTRGVEANTNRGAGESAPQVDNITGEEHGGMPDAPSAAGETYSDRHAAIPNSEAQEQSNYSFGSLGESDPHV
jgi:hypothetical protein